MLLKRALRLGRQAPAQMTPGQVAFFSKIADDEAHEQVVAQATAHRASRMKKRDWEKFLRGE